MTLDIHKNFKIILLLFLVIIAVAIPRLLSLDHFATPDEAAWVGRSASFYYALAHRDFAYTFQHSHPGVMVTWAGTAAFRLRYLALAWEARDWVYENWKAVEPFLKSQGISPLEILTTARLFMVLGTILALGIAFLAARRLVGLWPAFVGFLLIAFDPFHIGLTRILHHDGLESSLMLLALFSFIVYFFGGGRLMDLLISGIAMGFSWLTKSPAFYLLFFLGLLVAFEIVRNWQLEGRLTINKVWKLIWPLLVVFCIGLAVFITFWPVMWVDPLGTLEKVFSQAQIYAKEGHVSEIFFNGNIIKGDPGWVFYPITFLWRTTPLVMVGLCLAGIGILRRMKPFDTRIARHIAIILVLYALMFIFMMSLGAKKFDRYIIPSYLPLDFLAGIGWFAIAFYVWKRAKFRVLQWLSVLLLSIVVFFQVMLVIKTYPYYLSYYNPWMGGSERAPEVMMIGWGEGLDQAARYLNAKPDAEHLRVMSYYPDGSFSYFFLGETLDLVDEWKGIDSEVFDDIDYIVLYYHQWQRQRPYPKMLDYFASQIPEYIVSIDGLDYARIYNVKALRK